jgi:hypothetical protein
MDLRYLVGGAVLCMVIPPGYLAAQTDREETHPVTLIGCVMRESDYRDTYGPGLSGVRGPGIGLSDEYMLVDAREIPSATIPPDAATPCPAAGTTFPTAYELTGPREKEIAEYVGKRVVLTGIQKEATVRPVGTSGVLRPTGGFDPLGHELHLFEVEANTFRDVTATLAEAPAAAPTPAAPVAPAPPPPVAAAPPAPAPEAEVAAAPPPPAPAPPAEPPVAAAPPPAPPAPEPAPAPQTSTAQQAPVEQPRQVAQAPLPNTASPLPLIGLIGLLSLSAAAGIRLLRRHG